MRAAAICVIILLLRSAYAGPWEYPSGVFMGTFPGWRDVVIGEPLPKAPKAKCKSAGLKGDGMEGVKICALRRPKNVIETVEATLLDGNVIGVSTHVPQREKARKDLLDLVVDYWGTPTHAGREASLSAVCWRDSDRDLRAVFAERTLKGQVHRALFIGRIIEGMPTECP